jgi:hypothetical protein
MYDIGSGVASDLGHYIWSLEMPPCRFNLLRHSIWCGPMGLGQENTDGVDVRLLGEAAPDGDLRGKVPRGAHHPVHDIGLPRQELRTHTAKAHRLALVRSHSFFWTPSQQLAPNTSCALFLIEARINL